MLHGKHVVRFLLGMRLVHIVLGMRLVHLLPCLSSVHFFSACVQSMYFRPMFARLACGQPFDETNRPGISKFRSNSGPRPKLIGVDCPGSRN